MKIKAHHKLLLLSPETMKLLGSTEQVTDKDKNSKNAPKLESVEVNLNHCNLLKNDFQQASKVIFTFVSNKKFAQLINIAQHSLILLNKLNTNFIFIGLLFTDQNSKPLTIEGNVNTTFVIG